ncbi:transcription termination factor MTERF15, mitochondrial [Beta vulgaris subsp. vulgaris]|uniref:transcription termination factor MTERF15, mitochondrial n=1 Tax=Beta vulgaris subsp. vulgaris TaxID=3555 RepID=UPI0020369F1A|nr:transcription termination factor MTERF15, mitochondrial [Beta vulgaris subsp. vulgaris]
MAFYALTRNHFRKLNPLSLHQISIPKFPKFLPFSNIPNSQSFNLSNSLQQSQYRKQISLANLLQRYGFPSSELHAFLTKNKFLLSSNVSEIEQSMGILLLSFKLQQNLLVSLVYGCPSILDLVFLKKWEVGISSLGLLSSSPRVVSSILEFSKRYRINPDRYCSCVQILKGLGFSDGTISSILEGFPGVVMIDENELRKRIDFWVFVGIGKEAVDKIYLSFPGVLGFQVESRLKPLLNEFLDMGFGRRLVREEIIREPRILNLELGELRRCLELIQRLKCRESIREKILSKGEFRAGFSVKVRVDCLCRYGLIRRDALSILKREPRSITYDIEDIESKIEFLLERMKLDVECLIEVPEYLGVNFEKQIVPRYNVIEYLRSRGGLGFEVGLRDIIKPSRLRFYNLYVKPYPECEKLYGRFSEYVEQKNRHPVGLWKHFKPPKYEETKEDLKNLKSFTEFLV